MPPMLIQCLNHDYCGGYTDGLGNRLCPACRKQEAKNQKEKKIEDAYAVLTRKPHSIKDLFKKVESK